MIEAAVQRSHQARGAHRAIQLNNVRSHQLQAATCHSAHPKLHKCEKDRTKSKELMELRLERDHTARVDEPDDATTEILVALSSLSRDLSWLNLFAEKAIKTFWCIKSTGVTQPLIRADGRRTFGILC